MAYYNPNSQNAYDFKSTIYISKKIGTTQDEYLNQIEVYGEPIKCKFNIQPVSADSDIREFGELSNSMKVAVITEKQKYLNKFNEFDLAYIKNIPNGEPNNGDYADYRIYAIRNQNTIIRIYFLKLVK